MARDLRHILTTHRFQVTSLRGSFHASPIGEKYMSEDIEQESHRFTTIPAEEFSLFTPVEARQDTERSIDKPVSSELSSLAAATEWLNSQPLSATDLHGKVVLIDFWTYTCINWLRTLPYVRAWAEKYKEHGVVTIGVHSPEFSFEHDIENVRRAAKEMRVAYPIAIDSDYAIWRAFNNAYWPALYFIDKNGRIRHHHFGEGGYEQSERIIQQLLGGNATGRELVSVEGRGAEAPADWSNLKSPENYLGYERTENFASPGG